MATLDVSKLTQTDMTSGVEDYSVDTMQLDSVGDQKETFWQNNDWSQNLGYYLKIPELKKPIDALAFWTVGKGFTTDTRTQAILDNITGWGEDTIENILWNMIVQKKVNGDAYAEIIRNDDGTLINLKPLNPGDIRIVVDGKGIIKRYEQLSKADGRNTMRKFKPQDMFHISNDRLGDSIHGIAVVEACEWIIKARNEAMNDWKRISHRSTIRVMYIAADNTTKLNTVKAEYATAINKGELMIIPAKKGEAEFQDLTLPPAAAFLEWIRYLENVFYQAVGVPRIIVTSEGFTEAGGKIGYLTFEPVYTWEQTQLEADLWNQLAIRVKFNRPPSLGGALQTEEQKNQGQQNIQPNDTQAGVGE
jgi:hypothetical protein